MAKIRDIKNEVNYLTYEILSDCNTFIALHPEKRGEAVQLMQEAAELRNELINKINHPAEVNAAYFRQIRKELVEKADSIFEKLRKLIK